MSPAERLDHLATLLAIVTTDTLRDPAFRAAFARRLREVAAELRRAAPGRGA